MKIAIGADHGGYKLKEEIKKYLEELSIEYIDLGTDNEQRTDYPIYASKVAKLVQKNECERGILICRSSNGMAICANKYKGIICTICHNEYTAKYARLHNNSNVLALGADDITTSAAISILRIWLGTNFEGGRHKERLNMIQEIEKENMK